MKTLVLSFFLLALFSASAQDKPEGLFINSKAPDFKVKDQSGVESNTKDLRKKGPIVLIFYRGHWCPYCNKELTRLQDSLSLLTAKGAQLIAVTPEAPDGINKTIEKTGAVFPIIYDQDMKIARAYKVAYTVEQRSVDRYKGFGTDLLAINGQKKSVELPVPAVYIINKDGAVTYRYFNEDYKKRPSVKEILDELK